MPLLLHCVYRFPYGLGSIQITWPDCVCVGGGSVFWGMMIHIPKFKTFDHMLYFSRWSRKFWLSSINITSALLYLFHLHLKALYFPWARNCCVPVLKRTQASDINIVQLQQWKYGHGYSCMPLNCNMNLAFQPLKTLQSWRATLQRPCLALKSSGRIFNIIPDLSTHIISESMSHVSFTLHSSYYWGT